MPTVMEELSLDLTKAAKSSEVRRCQKFVISGWLRRVVKWQGGSFLVLFKSGGHMVSSTFHLFVSDVDQQRNERAG